jgi:dipeptidyl aminopeptidase
MHIPSSERPTYEQLTQEAEEPDESLPVSAVRPPVYYGDGPFDPPSSDEEDAGLLDKTEPASPGSAERGGNGLILGHKVRSLSFLLLPIFK